MYLLSPEEFDQVCLVIIFGTFTYFILICLLLFTFNVGFKILFR